MLQRIKKRSERDSNWIIEIGLKRSIRDDKRCTKNIFISLVESEWYFITYQPPSRFYYPRIDLQNVEKPSGIS